jgi:hypothetical protein
MGLWQGGFCSRGGGFELCAVHLYVEPWLRPCRPKDDK